MDIVGVLLFKSDSGSTLYSRKTKDVQEDLFSAFLTALKSFFSDFALGGLSTFASEEFIVYLASTNNVLTSIIIDKKAASDKYFSLAFDISDAFYKSHKSVVDSQSPIISDDAINFDKKLDVILENFDKVVETQREIIKLFQIETTGDVNQFDFVDSDHLNELSAFIAINLITKHIFIIENSEDVPNRILFFANQFASNINQREYKSEFVIRNISEPWDVERLIDQFANLLSGKNIDLKTRR
jgi:hypothetical protein